MNAYELSNALKRRRKALSRKRNPSGGRPRTVSPHFSDEEINDIYNRHLSGESIISIANGNEAIRVTLCRELNRRGYHLRRGKGFPAHNR